MNNQQPTPKLLPCPFCGGYARSMTHEGPETYARYNPYRWMIDCDGCAATLANFRAEDEAIKAWNTRASLQPEPSRGSVKLPEYSSETVGDWTVLHKRPSVDVLKREAAEHAASIFMDQSDRNTATQSACRTVDYLAERGLLGQGGRE